MKYMPEGSDQWLPNDWRAYNDVIEALRESLGLTLNEAREEYTELREFAGDTPDVDDVVEYVTYLAEEAVEEYYPETTFDLTEDELDEPDYVSDTAEVDYDFDYLDLGDFDDVWLDAEDEIELSVLYK